MLVVLKQEGTGACIRDRSNMPTHSVPQNGVRACCLLRADSAQDLTHLCWGHRQWFAMCTLSDWQLFMTVGVKGLRANVDLIELIW